MNSKMTTNSHQQLNLKNKNKLSKQLEQEQNHRNGDYMEGYQRGGERMSKRYREKMVKVKHNWQVHYRQGEIKNSIGSGEAKEFTCMTHGHELRGDNAGRREVVSKVEEGKGERKTGQV